MPVRYVKSGAGKRMAYAIGSHIGRQSVHLHSTAHRLHASSETTEAVIDEQLIKNNIKFRIYKKTDGRNPFSGSRLAANRAKKAAQASPPSAKGPQMEREGSTKGAAKEAAKEAQRERRRKRKGSERLQPRSMARKPAKRRGAPPSEGAPRHYPDRSHRSASRCDYRTFS